MKKIIVACTVFCTLFAQVYASSSPKFSFASSVINYHLGFHKLVVNDELNVILQEGNSKEFIVSGNEKDIQKLQWCIQNGVLTLGVKNGNIKEKITVLITVSKLKEIELNSFVSLTNLGSLTNSLKLQVNNSSNIALSSVQPIVIAGPAASEIEVKQKNGRIIFE